MMNKNVQQERYNRLSSDLRRALSDANDAWSQASWLSAEDFPSTDRLHYWTRVAEDLMLKAIDVHNTLCRFRKHRDIDESKLLSS